MNQSLEKKTKDEKIEDCLNETELKKNKFRLFITFLDEELTVQKIVQKLLTV